MGVPEEIFNRRDYILNLTTTMKQLSMFLLFLSAAALCSASTLRFKRDALAGLATFKDYKGRSYAYVNKRVTFTEAEGLCNQLGMDLVSISTIEENEFVNQLAPTYYIVTNPYPWIGLKKNGIDGQWAWMNSSLLVAYTNWHSSQPNGDGDCAGISYTPDGGTWYDGPCTESRPFVCEKNLADLATFKDFKGRSYAYVNIRVTFTEAEGLCNQLGMDLVSISTIEENEFVNQLAHDKNIVNIVNNIEAYPWVGLKKDGIDGQWAWRNSSSSSSSVAYTNWQVHQPNGDGDCA